MIQLGVNIDHVASVRQARYRGENFAQGEPDPVRAAHEVELGGGDGITVHLREDRRHIHDRDLLLLRQMAKIRLNLEMGATEEMVGIACRVGPHTSMLVPEGRDEVTTEGGLNVAKQLKRMKEVVKQLREAGLIVSAFIDADVKQVEAAAEAKFDVCEIHTGPYAHAWSACGGDLRREELAKALNQVADAGEVVMDAGMRFNAGHALNYHNVGPIAAMPGISELHIGHAIVSRAIFTGLRTAVREMKDVMERAASYG
jgi:pyridoxine 5-phosphate synthase